MRIIFSLRTLMITEFRLPILRIQAGINSGSMVLGWFWGELTFAPTFALPAGMAMTLQLPKTHFNLLSILSKQSIKPAVLQ